MNISFYNNRIKMKKNRKLQLQGDGFKGSLTSLLETCFLFVGTGLALLVAIAIKSIVSKLWGGVCLPALSTVLVMTIFVIMDRKIFGIDDKTSYTLEDFVPGSYAKLIQCYSYGNSWWAIFCPIDENPSDKNVVHVRVTENFWRLFADQNNKRIRFVQGRGDIQDRDRNEGIWPVVFDEVLEDPKPIRCKRAEDQKDFCGNDLKNPPPFLLKKNL